jgi:hypothetical protein
MDPLPATLQDLIESTDALDLDCPQLATIAESPQPQPGAFSLIG